MSHLLDIAVFVGSLRRASFSLKVARSLASVAPVDLTPDIVEMGHLPFYNEDLDVGNPPASWVAFRERIRKADAVLFVTPEYNRSVPAVLKNALDVGSRPYGENAWAGKPGAVVSTSPGAIGGFGANHHLRQSLVFLDIPTMQQPEAYLGGIDQVFDENGQLANDRTRDFLTAWMTAYETWVKRLLKKQPVA